MCIFHCGSSCSNISSFLVCFFSFRRFNIFIVLSCPDLAVNGSYVCSTDDVLIVHSKVFSYSEGSLIFRTLIFSVIEATSLC